MLYGLGGLAGGLVFTLMNNALPLFLKAYTMPFSFSPFFEAGAAVPATIVALLANERSLFGGLIQPLIGSLSDRTRSPLGKRSPYILAGGAGTALCIAALALQPPFWLMIAAVTLAGVFLFVALGPYIALLADIMPYSQRGRAGGLTALAGVVGALAVGILANQMWDRHRWLVFLMTAAGVAISLAIVAFSVREPETSLPAEKGDTKRDRLADTVRTIASYRPLAWYVAAMGVYWLGAGAATPFITRFGTDELGATQEMSFALLLPLIIATAVGAVASGFLADKVGHRRLLRPGLALFAVGATLSVLVRDMGQAVPVMVLVGLANGVLTALHIPFLADLVPKRHAGEFMGFASMIWSVAQPVGAVLAGFLADFTGSFRGVFFLSGICMLAATLLLGKVPEKPQVLEE
jgi:MFS family permease